MEDLLKQILGKLNSMESDIKELKSDVKDLKEGQSRIEAKLDDLEPKNATRHTEILNRIDTLSKDLVLVEAISSKNMSDIAHLKLIK